jgi:oligoendopeptidase F
MLNTSSRLHKFKDYVDATAFADEIDSSLITNLYKNAEIFKTSCQQYNKVYATFLKKKLHLKSLEP